MCKKTKGKWSKIEKKKKHSLDNWILWEKNQMDFWGLRIIKTEIKDLMHELKIKPNSGSPEISPYVDSQVMFDQH